MESKGDAKCFGERREQEEGVFLSYMLYFLIAIGISVKLNCNSWTTNVYCNNGNIIKLISPILEKQAVPLFVFLLRRDVSQRISLWEPLSRHEMSNTIYVDTASFFPFSDRKWLYLVR